MLLGAMTYGQGVPATFFTLSPQYYNPGFIGSIKDEIRIAGLHRVEYNGESNYSFTIYDLAVDAPVFQGFRSQDWIGLGASYTIDRRGVFSFDDRIKTVGVSYHLGIEPKSSFAFGMQFKSTHRSLDVESLNSGAIIGSVVFLESNTFSEKDLLRVLSNDGNFDRNFIDIVIGVTYQSQIRNGHYIVGLGMGQFMKKVLNSSSYNNHLKSTASFQMVKNFTDKLAIEPAVFIQAETSSKKLHTAGQCMASYQVRPKREFRLKGGLGFRSNPFMFQVLGGASCSGFYANLAYNFLATHESVNPISSYAFEMVLGCNVRIGE